MVADSKNRHSIRIDIEMKNNSVRWTGTDAEQELTYSVTRQPGFRHKRATFGACFEVWQSLRRPARTTLPLELRIGFLTTNRMLPGCPP
jgi:hypothetical protein